MHARTSTASNTDICRVSGCLLGKKTRIPIEEILKKTNYNEEFLADGTGECAQRCNHRSKDSGTSSLAQNPTADPSRDKSDDLSCRSRQIES